MTTGEKLQRGGQFIAAAGLTAAGALQSQRLNPRGLNLNAPQGTHNTTTALQTFFPGNNGFLVKPKRHFLKPGQRIDRFGGTGDSRFFSPAGTAEAARALPPGTSGQPLRTFEVLKPFEVHIGTVTPAFGQSGLGTQFMTPVRLETLLNHGIIKGVTQ